MDEISIYVCPQCKKTFKVKGNNKKVKCPQCAKDLLDLTVSLEAWDVLDKDSRDELKSKVCNANLDEQKSVVKDNILSNGLNERKQSFFGDAEAVEPKETPVDMAKPEFSVCPKCNKPIQITSKFCPECGYNLNKNRRNRERKSIKPICIIVPAGVILLTALVVSIVRFLPKMVNNTESLNTEPYKTVEEPHPEQIDDSPIEDSENEVVSNASGNEHIDPYVINTKDNLVEAYDHYKSAKEIIIDKWDNPNREGLFDIYKCSSDDPEFQTACREVYDNVHAGWTALTIANKQILSFTSENDYTKALSDLYDVVYKYSKISGEPTNKDLSAFQDMYGELDEQYLIVLEKVKKEEQIFETSGGTVEYEIEDNTPTDTRDDQYWENRRNITSQIEADNELAEAKKHIPSIGMTKEEVERSAWGKPLRINSSQYEWGTEEQWVYPKNRYVYFKDDICTSIQESK